MNVLDSINHVKTEVEKLQGKKVRSSAYTMVCCPFHNDSNPSGRISHDIGNPRFVGSYKCYACGDPMRWDDFATQTGLEPFRQVEETRVPAIPVDYLDDTLIGTDKTQYIKEEMELFPLDKRGAKLLDLETTEWRGFSFSFLRELGAEVCAIDDKYGRTHHYLYLPAYVNGKLRGYIKALPHKVKDMTSYINASGGWSKKYGLWPFDYVSDMLKSMKTKTVVLVEGPRDAMRLIRDGIPALCILGTQSWSSHKILLLETLEPTKIILCFDGDDAGKKATKLVYSGARTTTKGEKVKVASPLHDTFKVEAFDLASYASKDGEEFDPCSAPAEAIQDLALNL